MLPQLQDPLKARSCDDVAVRVEEEEENELLARDSSDLGVFLKEQLLILIVGIRKLYD